MPTFAMTIGPNGHFEAMPNPTLRSQVAPPPLPPPGSLKKQQQSRVRFSDEADDGQPSVTPSKPSNNGPLDLSELLAERNSRINFSTTPQAAQALAFFRRGREQGVLSPDFRARTIDSASRSQGRERAGSSSSSVALPSPMAASGVGLDLTPDELRAEVKLLRIKVGHLQRSVVDLERQRDMAKEDLANARRKINHEEEESKRSLASKIQALRSLGDPLKTRLEALLARGREEYVPGQGRGRDRSASPQRSRSPARAMPADRYSRVPVLPQQPSQQETRWSDRDLQTLSSAVTQLGLILEAQTTLAHRVVAVTDLVPAPQQVEELTQALERSQEAQAVLALQLSQAERERDALREQLAGLRLAAPLPASTGSDADARTMGTSDEQELAPSSGASASADPSDGEAGRGRAHSRARSVDVPTDAGLPGFGRVSAATLGATPSGQLNALLTDPRGSDGVADELDYGELLGNRAAWNSFLHELTAAVAPLEARQHAKPGTAAVAARGSILWEDARAIAHEHCGSSWDKDRANVSGRPTRQAELASFKAALGRAIGHNPNAIPALIQERLYDMVVGPLAS